MMLATATSQRPHARLVRGFAQFQLFEMPPNLETRFICLALSIAGPTNPWSVAVRFIRCLLRDENGATAIEYGLIAALIFVAVVTAVTSVGTSLDLDFQ